jgi:hypothetical protein
MDISSFFEAQIARLDKEREEEEKEEKEKEREAGKKKSNDHITRIYYSSHPHLLAPPQYRPARKYYPSPCFSISFSFFFLYIFYLINSF